MKKNKKATSIMEAIIATLIVTTWVVWMYKVYTSSMNLETHISNKITATQIAREWIEAITNIRDTNWVILWSDKDNCWNSLNYNTDCIMDTTTTYDIKHNWHYKTYQNTNNRWALEELTNYSSGYLDSSYRTDYRVWLDSNNFYTQTGTTTNLLPLFTREIIINYIDTNSDWADSNDEKMEITSRVQWQDKSSNVPHTIDLKTILTNWEK